MSNSNPKIVKSTENSKLKKKIFCNRCGIDTVHLVLSRVSFTYIGKDEPTFWSDYCVIQCNNDCHAITFMETHNHSDNLSGYDPDEGDVTIGEDEYIYYPERIILNKEIMESRTIPKVMKEIYYETISLVSKKMFRFAALGLRVIIEEFSKDKGAKTRDLSKKIKELRKLEIINDSDKNILFELKKFGDGAAHRNEVQQESILNLSLKIIEGLLFKFYVVDEKRTLFEEQKNALLKTTKK